jgi:hypothetical protein
MHTIRGLVVGIAFVVVGSAGEFAAERYTVMVIPHQRYSSVAVEEMGREASAILSHTSVDVRLRIGYTREAFDGTLVVVNLRGRCDMDAGPPKAQVGPLGWTHSENGRLLPFADLACESIRGAVQSAQPPGNRLHANAILGRAMGRVLAHELYHIAGATFKHGRDGVAKAALSPENLTAAHLDLDPADVKTIQNRQQGSR